MAKPGPFIAKHGLRVVDYIATEGTVGMTVVGHISSTGNIWTSAGQLDVNALSETGDTFKSTTAYHHVSSFSPGWTSTKTTVFAGSSNWNSAWTVLNANSGIWTWVANNSADAGNGNSAFTTLNANSARWNSVTTDVNANSGDWMAAETTVRTQSANWVNPSAGGWTDDGVIVRLTDALESVGVGTATPGEKLAVVGNISASGIIYDDHNNSDQWSSNWVTTNLNSGYWSTAHNHLKGVSSTWHATYTDVKNQSADWRSGYLLSIANHSTVNTNSGKWESGYTTLLNNSAGWESVEAHVYALSADWNASGAGAWSVNAESEVYRLTNVGIGTSNPSYVLDVVGDVRVTGDLTVEGISKDFKTSDKAITINHASTLKSAGSAGIEIEEGGNVSGSLKINNNRGGWTFLEPLSTRQLVLALSGVQGGASTWTVAGDLNVEGDSAINQDLTTDSDTVQFAKLGIGVAPSELLSVAGNISAQDIIYTGAGQSTQWQSAYVDFKALSGDINNNATVKTLSSTWASTYTTVFENSGNWSDTHSHVFSNSGLWDSTYRHVNTVSATWDWSYQNALTGTDNWNTAYTEVNTKGDNWDWAFNNALTGTNVWNSTNTDVNANSGNWETAYGWGDHSAAGYLTSYTETDPIFTAERPHYDSVYSTVSAGSANWNTAYGWGDHSAAGYLTSYTETDPIFTAERPHYDSVYSTVSGGSANWNTAYGWGDHSAAGYLTTETDPIFTAERPHYDSVYSTVSAGSANWNTAYGWGDHGAAGYLTSYTETDPIFTAERPHYDSVYSTVSGGSANWNAAFDDKINSASFNTGNGVLTLNQEDGGSVTVDLDGRYATAAAGVNADSVFTTVNVNSSTWVSTYSTVYNTSADWDWAYNNSLTGTDVWNSTHTDVYTFSAGWQWAYNNSLTGTDVWNSTNTDVNANSALWGSVYSTVHANSGTGTVNFVPRWVNTRKIGDSSIFNNGTFTGIGITAPLTKFVVSGGKVTHPEISATSITTTALTANTGRFDSVRAMPGASEIYFHDNIQVNSNVAAVTFNGINLDSISTSVHTYSAKWCSVYTTVDTYSALWMSTHTDVNANSANWEWAYNNALTGTDNWNSTSSDVNANSGNWQNAHASVNALSATWSSSVSGVSAERIGRTYTFANSFTAGRIIRRDPNGSFQLAKANAPLSADVIGVVQSADANKFDIVFSGILDFPSHGFTIGKPIYLSETWDGSLTETEPTTFGTVTKPVGIVIDDDTLQIIPWRGIYNNNIIENSVYTTVNINSADWTYVAKNSGAGASLRATITQTNTFSAGRAIYVNGSGTYVTSRADNVNTADVVGVVQYADANEFLVYYGGVMPWTSHGKTVGANLFLSKDHTGWLTEIPVTDVNAFNKPVAFVLDANNILVWPQRGIQNTSGGGGGGGGGGWTDDGSIVRLTTSTDKVSINTNISTATLTVAGTISAQSVIYDSCGDTAKYCSTWKTLDSLSADWESAETTVRAQSSTWEAGGGGGGHTIQYHNNDLTARTNLNFLSSGGVTHLSACDAGSSPDKTNVIAPNAFDVMMITEVFR